MVALAEKPTPGAVEGDARSVWNGQRLPPAQGPVGPADGPVVRQFLGAFAAQENGTLVAQRAVAADVDARAMMLAGRRAQGSLRLEEGGPPVAGPRLAPALAALGIWVGGGAGKPWDAEGRRPEVQNLVGRLAHVGALAVRDVSLRICPACATVRSPERIVYQEEDGETLLVRFAFPDGDRTVSALVWTDAAWRLLGTSALMIHPDLPYVIARYRRKGAEELVFCAKSALGRIRDWLPGSELEVQEEHPGRHWEGRAYVHPLRHEFPMGGTMEPPCGTIVPIADVSDTGTGVVPLVPGHGGTDTQIADRLRLPGWPLVTPKGRFDILFVHKYAGLELESGNEFVSRDLEEDGAIFARLRVRRGVPHCARCGTPLIWAPGRAWCLEPSRLPAEKVALYRSLLPHDRPIERLEVVPWPVSEPQRSDDPLAISLLECSSCDRLDAVEHVATRCVCGGRRRPIRRRLLAAFDAAASAWAGVDPFAPSDVARIYVNERRRAPSLVHHIAAMSGVAGNVGDVRLTLLPTVPEEDLLALVAQYGTDAVRAAFVRAQGSEGATATFTERCAQEGRRLAAFWQTARRILLPIDSASLVTYAQPISGALGELLPEDRSLLARFERMRIQATVDYDRSMPAAVHRRLFAFLENDLPEYLGWVAARLAENGAPPSKRSATHTLVHVLFGATQLLGPIAPFTAESVHRALRRSRASVFQEPAVGVDRTLLDPTRAKAWDRWLSVLRATDRFRRALGVPPEATIPTVALIVESDPVGDEYRAEAPTIERLARLGKLEVGTPGAPWSGRRRQLKPRESEIQRVYSSRAAQIMHLLRRMPERKATDMASGQGFTMMVNGQPTQILPSMVEWEETLPDRYVPVGWSGGEMYAAVPPNVGLPANPPPPLSRDGLEIAARIRQRLRFRGASGPSVVILAVPPVLAAELTSLLIPLARYVGASEVRLVASDRELPSHGLGFGRTHAGVAWAFHISDAPGAERATKRRPPRAKGARVRPAFAPGELLPSVRNYADPEWIARETAVRALGEELDSLLGAPLLGPAKVNSAWDAGLRDVPAFQSAPWATIAGLPGFGEAVADVLVARFGGVVPPPRSSEERRAALGIRHRTPAPVAPVTPAPVSSSVPTEIVLSSTASLPRPPAASPPALPRPVAPTSAPSDGAALPSLPAPVLTSLPPAAPAIVPPAAEPAPVAELAPEPARDIPGPADSGEGAVVEPAPAPSATAELGATTEVPTSVSEPSAPPPATPLIEAEMVSPSPGSAGAPMLPEPAESPPAPSLEETPASGESLEPVGLPEPPAIPAEPSARPTVEQTPTTSPSGPASDEVAIDVASPISEPETAPPPAEMPTAAAPEPEPPQPVVDSTLPTPPAVAQPSEFSAEVVEIRPEEAPTPPEAPPATEPVEPTLEAGPLGPEAPESPSPPAEPGEATPSPSGSVPELNPPPPPTSSPVPAPLAPAPVMPPTIAETLGFPTLPESPSRTEPTLAVPPPAPPPAAGVDLAVGPSYFPSLERFLEATAAGHQGICVVRDSPERIRAYVGSRPVEIRWLTNIGRGPTLKPTDLDGFSAFLDHAVSTGHVTAFFLEGVEYLVRLHGLDRVVERMVAFDRLAREHAARVWLPLNPKLLSPSELERFVSAFAGAVEGGEATPAPDPAQKIG